MAKSIKTLEDYRSRQVLSLAEGTEAYQELRQYVVKSRLLDRTYGYYMALIFFVFTAFFFSFAGVYFTKNLYVVVLLSIIFAFFSVQIGGLIHDAGHRSIFKTPIANDIFAQVCTLVFAACYNNWRINHNRHHAYPNQETKDPDMEIPYGFTHDRFQKLSGFMGSIKRYQKYTYYPFGTLASLTMRFKRYDYFQENFGRAIYWEIALFIISAFIRFVFPFLLFGIEKASIFLAVSTLFEGFYMFHIFAPNHKGMTELGKDIKLSFLEQQIVTSRNVKGHPITDFVYLGLNYQIEHHLFPNTPRINLKKITPYVLAICEKYNLKFSEASIIESNRIILSNLSQIGQSA